ncbi:MAG: mechanosensitive ion channel domain-containing protein, partial [Synechococcaceae cyanobacterium]|nr:mechanosensitive ion channel domain-containing protein [Synechococcaceae cyanobacterium]
ICLAWFGLQLLETQLLVHTLPPQARHVLVSRLLRPAFLVVVLLALLDALGSLQDISTASLGVWFGSEISVGRLFTVLLVLYLLLVGLAVPSRWVSGLLQRGLALSDGTRKALEQILRYVLVGLGIVWAVTSLGINQTALLAVAGGLSVGLGFGIKEVVSNIISGLWLLIEGSVRPGEVLMHDGDVCEVRRLGPRATTLWRGSDNAELVVPNQNFFTTSTTTYTRSDRMRRCQLSLSVERHWPPDQVIALLAEIAASQPDVLASPGPLVQLQAFGPQSYTYGMSYSIGDPLKAGKVAACLRLEICRRFQHLGIALPS